MVWIKVSVKVREGICNKLPACFVRLKNGSKGAGVIANPNPI